MPTKTAATIITYYYYLFNKASLLLFKALGLEQPVLANITALNWQQLNICNNNQGSENLHRMEFERIEYPSKNTKYNGPLRFFKVEKAY